MNFLCRNLEYDQEKRKERMNDSNKRMRGAREERGDEVKGNSGLRNPPVFIVWSENQERKSGSGTLKIGVSAL